MPSTTADIILVTHTTAPRVTMVVLDSANDKKARAAAVEIAARTGRSVSVCDDCGNSLFEIDAPFRH